MKYIILYDLNLSKKSVKENSLNMFSLYHILIGTECNKSLRFIFYFACLKKVVLRMIILFPVGRCWLYFLSRLRWLQTEQNEPEYF